MQRRMTAALVGLTLLGMTGTVEAIPVDLELSLVVDSSGSISTNEFNLQKNGYANAFRQPAVISTIVNSQNGIAVNTILFADRAEEVIEFTQTPIKTAQQVEDFAPALEGIQRITGSTNIPAGINLAVDTIRDNVFETGNIIIDVSGDGPTNFKDNAPEDAADTQAARDAALSAGVAVINGLAIGDDVLDFYEESVIGNLPGSPSAFVEPANSFNEFGDAIAQKIRLEVATIDPEPSEVAAPGAIGLIGFGVIALGWVMRRRSTV